MADTFTQVPPDSTGDKLHMRERVRGADTVLQQAVFLAEPPTWSAWANDVAGNTSKHYFTLFNGSGSGSVVQVHDFRLVLLQVTAITGVTLRFDVFKCSAASSGTTITPEKWDSGSAALNANITCRTNGTVTNGNRLFGFIHSNEEHTTAAPVRQFDGISLLPNINQRNQPLTLREGEGITLQQITTSVIGTYGVLCVFSAEPTFTA